MMYTESEGQQYGRYAGMGFGRTFSKHEVEEQNVESLGGGKILAIR